MSRRLTAIKLPLCAGTSEASFCTCSHLILAERLRKDSQPFPGGARLTPQLASCLCQASAPHPTLRCRLTSASTRCFSQEGSGEH